MTAIDVLAGSLVGRVLAPDWMATAELSLHLAHPPGTGEVVADASVVRAGRTTVVVDVGLRGAGADGAPFGEAMLTFVRLPRRDTTIDLSTFEVRYGERTSFATEASGLTRPFADEVGVVVQDAPSGAVRVDVDRLHPQLLRRRQRGCGRGRWRSRPPARRAGRCWETARWWRTRWSTT